MRKYVFAVVAVLGMAFFVASQDERAARDCADKAAQLTKGAFPAISDKEHSQENIEDTERYLPRWYGIFRWPTGTTTWAMILTLLAISEQTQQSRKAAQASAVSAKAALTQIELMVNKERAEIGFELEPFDPKGSVGTYMVEGKAIIRGATRAVIEETEFAAWIGSEQPDENSGRLPMPLPFVMEPSVEPIHVSTPLSRGSSLVSKRDGIEDVYSGANIYCVGFIRYRDIFRQRWEYRIRKRFVFRTYGLSLIDTGELDAGYWVNHGPTDANGEYKIEEDKKPN